MLVTAVALIFFVYVGMMVPIVPLFIEGPLDAGEFGIGLTVAVFPEILFMDGPAWWWAWLAGAAAYIAFLVVAERREG